MFIYCYRPIALPIKIIHLFGLLSIMPNVTGEILRGVLKQFMQIPLTHPTLGACGEIGILWSLVCSSDERRRRCADDLLCVVPFCT